MLRKEHLRAAIMKILCEYPVMADGSEGFWLGSCFLFFLTIQFMQFVTSAHPHLLKCLSTDMSYWKHFHFVTFSWQWHFRLLKPVQSRVTVF